MPRLAEPHRCACPKCGYDLRGIGRDAHGLVCPECGEFWREADLVSPKREQTWVIWAAHVVFGVGGGTFGGTPTVLLLLLWLVAGLMSGFGNQPPPSILSFAPFLAIPVALWVGLTVGAVLTFRRIFRGYGPAGQRKRVVRHLSLAIIEQVVVTVLLVFLIINTI